MPDNPPRTTQDGSLIVYYVSGNTVISRGNNKVVAEGLTLRSARALVGDLTTDALGNERIRQAWNLIEQGWSDRQIASEIDVSQDDVEDYRKRYLLLIQTAEGTTTPLRKPRPNRGRVKSGRYERIGAKLDREANCD